MKNYNDKINYNEKKKSKDGENKNKIIKRSKLLKDKRDPKDLKIGVRKSLGNNEHNGTKLDPEVLCNGEKIPNNDGNLSPSYKIDFKRMSDRIIEYLLSEEPQKKDLKKENTSFFPSFERVETASNNTTLIEKELQDEERESIVIEPVINIQLPPGVDTKS